MKSTGIVRKIDELGRIVIPKELRGTLDIDIKDPMEIYVNGEEIILKKYSPSTQCMLTGEISEQNISLGNGNIVLSPEGASEVLEKIEGYLQKQS
ncbi:AbrB/MazE/SpoVT family DNA-binding domain-containing protein [Alkalicoccobacillus gibsonii]|uniref:AbrB/MazE/SpoVT family DNA-binding domain-containing protein n=1 Tax=Alkalicoccobacillus gibsonii TaxID=79881 RepID=A0ABU9VJF1_9BACI